MNFQTVAANNGNLVSMYGTVLELGNSKLNVNQKPYRGVKLRDDTGEEHAVTINKGKGELPNESCLGQRLAFNLSTYQGQNGIAYSGFWSDKIQADAPPPQQAPPQAAPQPHQPTPSPRQPQNNNNGNKDRLIVTQVVYKAMMDKLGEVSKQQLISDVGMIMEVGTNPDIPF